MRRVPRRVIGGYRVSFGSLCLSVVLLSACTVAGVGNKQITDPSAVARIVPGRSTKADIRAAVGEPSRTSFSDSGLETWEYSYSGNEVNGKFFIPVAGPFMGGMQLKAESLTVQFGPNGVVRNVGKGSAQSVGPFGH